ncbi:MAG: MATE family efflux transporter [Anaeroplasmataceae bacterium]|nr:MATE family efflux transporter [Anaeroplasmataceae bacterium]MDE7384369.1 MATE family efflux transporter [Anaeroplasmataceae bacterium]
MQKTTEYNKLVSFKHLIILTIPIFFELLLQIIVGYSDQIMISKDQDAVTAITNTNTIVNVFIIAFQVFSMGAIILIGHYKGAKNYDKEKSVYSVAFVLSTGIGILISIILLCFSEYFFKWIHLDPTCMEKGLTYIRIVGGCLFLQAILTTISAFLKSNSYMKDSTIINAVVNVLNIIGNFILIPHLGIMGVAISSVVSRGIGVVIISIVFLKRVRVNIFLHPFKDFHKNTLKKIISIGGPSGGEALSYNASQILILFVVNSLGNKGVVNIKSYASMFAMISYMFTSAISQAMQVVIGELLGMGKVEESKKKIYQTLLVSVITTIVISVILYLISDYAYGLFGIKDKELLYIGKMVLLIEIALELGRAFNIVFVRALQTSGDIAFPTILSVIFCWGVAVLGSYLLGGKDVWLNLGLIGVWIAMALDECIRAVIFFIRFKSGAWERKLVI